MGSQVQRDGCGRGHFFVAGAEDQVAQVIAPFRDWLVDAVGCNRV